MMIRHLALSKQKKAQQAQQAQERAQAAQQAARKLQAQQALVGAGAVGTNTSCMDGSHMPRAPCSMP